MSGECAALAGRIRESLAELEQVIQRAEELAAKAQRTGDDGYWDGVALNLQCLRIQFAALAPPGTHRWLAALL